MQQLTSLPKKLWNAATNVGHNLLSTPTLDESRDLRDSFQPQTQEKDWTVLVYEQGTHRLAHSSELALNKMEQVGSTDRVNVVVQATVQPTYQERALPNMQSLPTRTYLIQKDADSKNVTSPVVREFDKALPLNGQTFEEFVQWGIQNFPSKHVLVVVKKHGAGFAGVSRTKKDGSADEVVPLSARDLSQALKNVQAKTGKGIDVLSFDSCSMQQMEVAYQVRNQVGAVVGSQEDVLAVVHPFGNNLAALNSLPSGSDAEQAAIALVGTYSEHVQRGMQSAVRAQDLKSVAASVNKFVQAVKSNSVDSSLLYTTMQSTPSSEPTQTSAMSYNFRDLGRFLEGVASDERYPQEVRQAATQANEEYTGALIARYASDDKAALKKPTGLSCFLPWKTMPEGLKENYQQLDWAKDSGWGELLDYALQPKPETGSEQSQKSQAPTSKPMSERIGKWGLKQYKKFISPFLTGTCAYTPSCSQYAREALQTYGLKEGSKLGFLRFVSCDGHVRGHDPVGGHQHDHDKCSEHAEVLPLIAAPSATNTPEQTAKAQRNSSLASQVGRMAGAVVGALVAAPVGAVMGAVMGYRTGRQTHQNRADELKETYGISIAHGYANIARATLPLEKVTSHLGTGPVAGVVGSALGVVGGTAAGMFQGQKWGKVFGQLWSENRVKEHYNELPQHPLTQAILDRDYQ